MVYYNQNYLSQDDEKPAWDLRQYRVLFIARRMYYFERAFLDRDYSKCLSMLDLWCDAVKHKMDKTEEDDYIELRDELISLSNKYKSVYLGKSYDAKGIEELQLSIFKMSNHLWEIMDKHNLFGDAKRAPSL